MKKVKKIIFLIVCISLFSICATGCQSKEIKEKSAKIVGEWKQEGSTIGAVTSTFEFKSDGTCKEWMSEREIENLLVFDGTYEFDKNGILYFYPEKRGKAWFCNMSFDDDDTFRIENILGDQIYKRQKTK